MGSRCPSHRHHVNASKQVLIVEDDGPTRERLCAVIAAHSELQVAAALGTCGEASRFLARTYLDVMLVDLGLPDGSGIDLIHESRNHYKPPAIMVLTVFGDERHVIAAIEAGACGYLLKEDDAAHIGSAITELLAGNSPISPAIARHVLKRLQSPAASAKQGAGKPPPLTSRERQILSLIARGFTYAEIAEMLFISASTVTSHIQNTYRKMEVKSRSEAVFEAVQMGIIRLSS